MPASLHNFIEACSWTIQNHCQRAPELYSTLQLTCHMHIWLLPKDSRALFHITADMPYAYLIVTKGLKSFIPHYSWHAICISGCYQRAPELYSTLQLTCHSWHAICISDCYQRTQELYSTLQLTCHMHIWLLPKDYRLHAISISDYYQSTPELYSTLQPTCHMHMGLLQVVPVLDRACS